MSKVEPISREEAERVVRDYTSAVEDALFPELARASAERLALWQRILATVPAWVPVTERVPEKGGRYLVCHIEEGFTNCWGDAIFVSGLWSGFMFTVTHWAYPPPLPAPPEVE